ncbi:hypothetical protein M0R45_026465 [Rubus argutus]|uniref:Uncharacterized protein n=1 Tax=Rubus argutus TaxID=59490 RepID=A0AAW1WXL4_RUBAR
MASQSYTLPLPPQPPKESFARRYKFLWPLLLRLLRLAWLGVEADPLVQSDDLLKAYSRPFENVDPSSPKWFISKNVVVSELGLLGIKQRNDDSVCDGESATPKTHRKRIVRKKVAA